MKPRTFHPEELFAHTKPSSVDRIVLIQPSFYGFDNSYMLDAMEKHIGVFSGIAVIDWNGKKPDEEMPSLAKRGVRGFRIYPKNAPIDRWLDGPGFKSMFAAGAKHNLAICPLINPDALPALDKQCKKFPDTPMIIDHLCRIGASQPISNAHIDGLCAMARHPRVMVKVSAFYALGKKEPPYDDLYQLIRQVYDAFGPKRLMWGSDSPYQVMGHTYEDGIGLVQDRLDFLSEADKEQILRKTAEDFFFK
jgi:predicted TIM-barrel fold metal-dependent hydrolase